MDRSNASDHRAGTVRDGIANGRNGELYQQVPSIYLATDEQGFVVDANEFGATYLGYTVRELLGRASHEIVHPDDRDQYQAHLRSCVEHPDRLHRLEFRKVAKSGEVVWVRETARTVTDPEGDLLVLSNCEDITELVQVERALRDSEEQLRSLTENLREVLWVADPSLSRISYLSPAYERVWGRGREESYADASRLLDGIEETDRGMVESTLRRMTVDASEVEFRIRRPDGELRWVSLRGFPVLGVDGAVRRVVGIAEDITEWRRLDDRRNFLIEAGRVLASSIEYETTLRNIAHLAVSTLADWCIVDLADGGRIRRVALACSNPELEPLAAEYQRNFPPSLDAAHGAGVAIRTGEPELLQQIDETILSEITRDEAQLATLRALGLGAGLAVPLKIDQRVLGAITLIRARGTGEFDDEDMRSAEILADRAALAIDTAALYGRAQQATALRDEVLSIVSHDLRNPLNTIMMSGGFLREIATPEQPGVMKQLEIIQRAAEQMNRLISDLLDVAQIEAGRLSVSTEPHDLRLLLIEASQSLRPLAESQGIELEVQLEEGLPTTEIDRDRILQVMGNLIGNAIKYTPAGGRITVGAAAADQTVRFWVSDTGSGIFSEDLPLLFDRFYQSAKTKKGGAGLGLAIVKGIVEAHRGRVLVASEVGKGSTFTIELPQPAG